MFDSVRGVRNRMSPRRRRLMWAFCLLVGLVAFYPVAANVFLASGLLQKLVNERPNRFTLDYQRAWSFWPGHAFVRGAKIRAQEPDIQWMLDVDRAEIRIDLKALFKKTFRAQTLHADGVLFRLRPLPGTSAPLPGYAMAPLPPGTVKERLDPKLVWQIELHQTVADQIREIWVAGYRYTGKGRASGELFVIPDQALELAPTTLVLEPGKVALGDKVLLESLTANVAVFIDRFDPAAHPSLDVLRFFTAEAKLSAALPQIDFVNDFAQGAIGRVKGGEGTMQVDAHLVRGQLMPSTRLSWIAHDLSLQQSGYQVDGTVDVDGRVEADKRTGQLRVALEVAPLSIRRKGHAQPLASGRGLKATLLLPGMDLAAGFGAPSLEAELLATKLAPVESLQKQLSPKVAPIKPESGSGRVSGKVSLSPGFERANGVVHLKLPELSVKKAGVQWQGDLSVDAEFSDYPVHGKFSPKVGSLELELKMQHMVGTWNGLRLQGDLFATARRKPGRTTQLSVDVSPLNVYKEGGKVALLRGPGLRAHASSDEPALLWGSWAKTAAVI